MDFWTPGTGPILLNLCGEYTCPGVMPARLFPVQLAQEHGEFLVVSLLAWSFCSGAIIITVEHRFFGKSQPTGDLSVASLRFHNSRQALNDWAYFLQWYQQQLNARFGTKGNLPVFTVGGSYPGPCAAAKCIRGRTSLCCFRFQARCLRGSAWSIRTWLWARSRPRASSTPSWTSLVSEELHPFAPLRTFSASAFNSMWAFLLPSACVCLAEFDQQIATSAGPDCTAALRATTAAIEKCAPGCQAQFGAQKLQNGDFWYAFLSSAVCVERLLRIESSRVPEIRYVDDLIDYSSMLLLRLCAGSW
jgi:hypothetical protein